MKKTLSIVLTVLMIMSMSVVAFAADGNAAKIGEAEYTTLTDALAAAVAGDTITFLDDVTEDVTISKNIIIDGADKTYTGKITLNKVTATIQNVNFVNSQIYKNKKTGIAGTITVKDCTFNGAIAENQYAINIGAANNIIIENCDAKDVGFGFFYAPSTTNVISIKNVNIDGASYGIHIVYNNTSTIENVTMKNVAYGVMNQTYAAKTITFKNCVIDATKAPVAIWERAAKAQEFIFKGENDFGTDDLTFGSSLVNATYDVAKLNGVAYTTLQQAIDACVEGDNTITLLYGCDETVTIKQQAGINIVLDGNNKTYSGTINIDGNKRPAGAETLTIKNVKFENTAATTYAYFINATNNASGGNCESHNVTVDSCSFKSNNWHYAIATRHPYNLTVKNCTAENVYYLIYNPQGGQKITVEDCTVTGATYGIGSQKCKETSIKNYTYTGKAAGIYGRANPNGSVVTMENVDITTTLAGQPAITLWKNNDATTSKTFKFIFKGDVKIAAPEETLWFARQSEANSPYEFAPKCYDNVVTNTPVLLHTPGDAATCQTAQFCTECGAETDAIKEHEFGEYVSDDNATCQKDGTKTATCIYGCGTTDTITDKGTKKEHNDSNGNGECDFCSGEFCTTCGRIHNDMISSLICLLIDFIKLVSSFVEAVF